MQTIHKQLSSALWVILLTILGTASMISLRWVSPSLHMESSFGASYDLTYAIITGLMILLAGAIAPWGKHQSISFFLKISLVLLLVGIIISTLTAGDKAAALYPAGGLCVAVALMFITARLADRPWKIHLALITVTALGATFAAKTWIRERYEMDQTWQNYLETRTEFWAKQGKSLDDPSVALFEERMRSRDNGGFFFHGNLGGMYLSAVLFVSLAMVAHRWSGQHLKFGIAWLIGSILVSLFILSALILTQSKGAILATILTVILLAILWMLRGLLLRNFQRSVFVAAMLLSLGTAAVIGYGLVKHTLPTLSMAYRWQYWISSYRMFLDHPLTGVGLGNYGHYYQKYKLPEAEEEITSPHNYIVQGFTQLGLFGGIGYTLLPLAVFYEIARRSHNNLKSKIQNLKFDSSPSAPKLLLVTAGGIFLLVFLFNPAGLPGPFYLFAEYLPYIATFCAVFVLCSLRGDQFGAMDDSPLTGAAMLLLTGALIAFMLGEVVNFSLEEPSTQYLFFFLAGLTLAGVSPPTNETKQQYDFVNIGFFIAVTVFSVGFVYPGIVGETLAQRVVDEPPAYEADIDPVCRDLAELSRRYCYDTHLPAQEAKRLLAIAAVSSNPVATIELAIRHIDEAIARSRVVWEFHSKKAQCLMKLAELDPSRAAEYLSQAEASFEDARRLAPTSKSLAMSLGLLYARHVKSIPSDNISEQARLTAAARKNLNDALQLNGALPVESHRRLMPGRLAEIETALKNL